MEDATMRKLAFLLTAILFSINLTFSQTHIPGGNISGTWTAAGSPYIIDGNIVIQSSDSLLIEPGVQVLFSEKYAFTVFGRLIANGTESDSILFSNAETYYGFWNRVKFYNTVSNGQDSSVFNYCIIEKGTHYEDTVDIGGGIYLFNSSDIKIANTLIQNCEAIYGGGLACYHSSPTIKNSHIKNNTAWGSSYNYGGGIWLANNSNPQINYMIIENNTVLGTVARGGGLAIIGSYPILNNLTIYGNDLQGTSENYGDGIFLDISSTVYLKNSILWNNSEEVYIASGTLDIQYSDIQGGYTGTGSIDMDPEFIDPDSGDFGLYWNFPFGHRSHCINNGDPSYPLDPDGSRSDMGAVPYFASGTYVNGGDICGTWELTNSPYLVEGEINVPMGCELEIQHGVDVVFIYREALNIYGRLIAEGLSWDKIVFTDGDSRWKGIKFYNTNTNGQDSSLIEHAEIKNVLFVDPDFHTSGGGLYFENSSDVNIRDCEIHDCFLVGDIDASGAGISCNASSPKIRDIIIRDCEAEGPATLGTAIYCHTNSNPEITKALIYNNNSDAVDYAYGGGIGCVASNPVLTNITITQNSMTGTNQYGGAIYADGADPVITNCIFYNNDNAEIYTKSGANPIVTYSNVEGGSGQPWFGTGCIDADPLFLDPGSYDFSLSWDNFPVPDATMSPCIDSGDPVSPTDPDGTQADIGALPFYQAYWLCGNTKGTLTLSGSPYIVTCDVMVLSTDSLFIEPGVEVIFMDNYKLEVHGRLVAIGTVTDSIHFRPYDYSKGWHGIRFFDTETNGQQESVIKYCDISGGLAFEGASGDEWGGGILCYNSPDVEISNTTIKNNRAFDTGLGGGIYCYNSDITIDSVNIFDNYAGYAGGGIYLDDSDPVITRTIIAGNYASTTGAGIHIEENSSPEITNVTITENTGALLGGGIYIFNTTPTIKNTIVWNNENGSIGYAGTNAFSVTYSVVEGGWPGVGNIDSDPLFSDPDNYNFSLSWDNYPEPDETKSSSVDLGDPASPPDEDGTRADIGAVYYEQTFTSLAGGDISETLYCSDSPYFVFGDLNVPTGDELIIEPCVYVVFQGDYHLQVQGRLLAEGTNEDKITFYPADSVTGWQGIRFFNSNTNGQDSSKLVHCHIMYGNADVLYGYDAYGGGVYLNNSSDVLIDNCLFYGNRAVTSGGGMFLTQSSPVIRNSIFIGNKALNGGAICCYDNVNTTFLDCSFENNSAENGGAIVVSSCAPEFSGSTMTNNRATKFGGAIYHDASGAPTFDNLNKCNIYDNYADYAGLDFYTTAGYYNPPVLDIYLDTASVAIMNKHFAFPIQYFNITSDNAKFVQEDADLYVSTTGSDLNSGTSAAEPLQTIKMALIKIIADSDDPKTIHIADGIYSVSETEETFPVNHRSYVSLAGENRATTIIDGDSLSRLLISFADVNDSIKKLTFQHGHKNGDGGAVVIENNSNPAFYDVTFQSSHSTSNGGAIWCFDDCNPIFSTVYFVNNISGSSGGALYFQGNDTIIMENCIVNSNTSLNSGGGIYAAYNDYFLLNKGSISFNNLSNGGGGGASFRQGSVSLWDLWVNGNNVIGSGAGMFADYNVDLKINSCTFSYNMASGAGGGLYFYNGVDANLENVRFFENSSVHGGGIYGYYSSTLNIQNGLFCNNNTMYDTLLYGKGNGAAMNLNFVETNLYNVTVANNVSSMIGGGLYFYSDASTVHNVQNSIIYDNTPEAISTGYDASVAVNFSDIEGGWPSGTGNIDIDPDFVNPAIADFQLNAGSHCINAGNPDTTGMFLHLFDLAGKPRICNDTVDMGAYEFFQGIELQLKAFLEGPFNGSTMNTNLTGLTNFPFHQPYNSPPWNYHGTEEVFALPVDNVADWILVEVRDTTDVSLASSESIVGRQAVFLLNDGSLVDINGNNIRFGNPIEHQCYITVNHRNHLGVLSAYPLTESGGVYTYDFTTPSGQAYGTDTQKELGSGVYGMYGGDGNVDGIISTYDKTNVWSIEAGTGGYLYGDFNMDSQVDNKDKNNIWVSNVGEGSQVPE